MISGFDLCIRGLTDDNCFPSQSAGLGTCTADYDCCGFVFKQFPPIGNVGTHGTLVGVANHDVNKPKGIPK